MKNLTITYKTLRVIPGKIERQIPEHWHEVSPQQLIAIVRMYKKEVSDRKATGQIYNLPWHVLRMLDKYEIYVLLNQLEFIGDFKPHHTFIIRSIGPYYMPKTRLEHMSFGQFMFIDTYFDDYALSQKTEDLHKFIAALCLKKNEAFDDKNIAGRVPLVAKQNSIAMHAIAINYRLIREWIAESYPMLFKGGNENEKRPRKGKGGTGWLNVFESIVGDDIVNSEKYAQMTVHQIFRFITRKLKGK